MLHVSALSTGYHHAIHDIKHKHVDPVPRKTIYELANLHAQYFLLYMLQQLTITVKTLKNKAVNVKHNVLGNMWEILPV
jgi:hypothetical protein